MHFAKVLCGCSISNLARLVRAHHPLDKGWAALSLFGAQCRDELHTGNGGYVPSCKGLSPPYRYLHQASLNNHNWEHRNLLLQGKRSKLAPRPCQMYFQKICRFCGGGLGLVFWGGWSGGCFLDIYLIIPQFSHTSLRDRTYAQAYTPSLAGIKSCCWTYLLKLHTKPKHACSTYNGVLQWQWGVSYSEQWDREHRFTT